jgi:putative transposase
MTIDAASFWAEGRSPNLATVRLRTKVTKGAGSREAGVAMAFKLLDAAQARWRRINGHELVPLVRAGATFIDGKLQERKEAQTGTTDTNKTGSVAA